MVSKNIWSSLWFVASIVIGTYLGVPGCNSASDTAAILTQGQLPIQQEPDSESATAIDSENDMAFEEIVRLADRNEMQIELGVVGDLMRQYFKENADVRKFYSEADLAPIMKELSDVTLWVVVPVQKGVDGQHHFAEAVEPRLIFHEESTYQPELTGVLKATPHLIHVPIASDGVGRQLYFGVTIQWIAREGRDISVKLVADSQMFMAIKSDELKIDAGDVKLEAQAPGVYMLRNSEKGFAAGWKHITSH